jgi:putative heme-binding domain-containing protein
MRRGGATRLWLLALLPGAALGLHAQGTPLSTAGPAEIAAGKRVFDSQCAWCHGADGSGGFGPSLRRPTLRHATSDGELVGIVRDGIPGTEMPPFSFALTEGMAWRTAAYIRSLGRGSVEPAPGNAVRGAALYETHGCQACHVIGGRGGVLGPELTTIGALRGVSYLRQAIVEPEAAHPASHRMVRAVLRAGGDVRGVRMDEDAFWVHLRDAAGVLHVIPKKDVVRVDVEPKGTLMPSYASVLTPADVDDLVTYLATQRGEP